jgi:NADH-quinone oxidoreductase subunit M
MIAMPPQHFRPPAISSGAGPVPSLGISYHVGVDGIGLTMVLLTGVVGFMGVLISWNIKDRIREFMAFFMLLVAGVFGVFV